jgi:hypothetical protein
LSFSKKVQRQLAMSVQLGNAHDNFKMVRDAKTKIIRPNDLEAELLKLGGFYTEKRSDVNDPDFKRLVKDYGKSIKDGDKGKILEKIVFDDGSAYYVVKGVDFKDGKGENVVNKVKSIIKRWRECKEERDKIANASQSSKSPGPQQFNIPLIKDQVLDMFLNSSPVATSSIVFDH